MSKNWLPFWVRNVQEEFFNSTKSYLRAGPISFFLSTVFLVPEMEPRIFHMLRKYSLHCILVQQELYTVLVHVILLVFRGREEASLSLKITTFLNYKNNIHLCRNLQNTEKLKIIINYNLITLRTPLLTFFCICT